MGSERRRDLRLGLNVPVRVQSHTPDGAPWEEMTSTDDASYGGCCFRLQHATEKGRVVHLSMPLPKRFRRYDATDSSYHIYALVRDVRSEGKTSKVGVLFLGKQPPLGHDKNPGGLFLLASDPKPASKERRRHLRIDNAFVNLKLQRLDAAGTPVQDERTIAENMGKGGARVLTSLPLAKDEVVIVEEVGGAFRTRAAVKNLYIGTDRVPRLNLQFLDEQAPDRLVKAG